MSNSSKKFQDYYPYGRAEFVMIVDDVENLNEKGKYSETYCTGDIDWRLNVCLNKKENAVAAHLFCAPFEIGNWWEVDSQYRIVLENKKNEKKSVARQMDFCFESETAENRGWNVFISFDDVTNEDRGFLVDGQISIRVMIGVMSVEGFQSPKYFDFTVDNKFFSDATISVDGFNFYVNKMILLVHSPIIGEHLKNKKGADLELTDIDRHEFAEFLQIVYAVPVRIHKNNICSLLKMCHRFRAEGVKKVCKSFLQKAEVDNLMSIAEIDKVTEAFNLPSILNSVIEKAKSADELTKKFGDLDAFSPEILKKVILKTLSLVK